MGEVHRGGRSIARLVPEPEYSQEDIDRALEAIRELRKQTGSITADELLSARDEGRKY